MNIEILKSITLLLVLMGSFSSCTDKSDKLTVIPYIDCAHEGEYLDTLQLEGVGLLFVDSVPIRLQNTNDVMYITYDKEQNTATFSANYPTRAQYVGNICNFPDFAKNWEISSEGKQIYYKGELHETGAYLSGIPIIGGDMILTTLINNK